MTPFGRDEAPTYLVIDERDLLLNALPQQLELELKVLRREDRVVVLLHVRCRTFRLGCSHVVKDFLWKTHQHDIRRVTPTRLHSRPQWRISHVPNVPILNCTACTICCCSSSGPSISASSRSIPCNRCSNAFARSANLRRRVSLILERGSANEDRIQGRQVSSEAKGPRTVGSPR